jgi:hypothetical protein
MIGITGMLLSHDDLLRIRQRSYISIMANTYIHKDEELKGLGELKLWDETVARV